jgi:DNA invertase Pin-like site-specific DNA recombinase
VLLELVPEPEPVRGTWADRPGLGYALRRIADGDASGLVVAKLTAVGRSVGELGEVLEWFRRSDARLVAVAQDLDTSQAAGLVTARKLMTVGASQRERFGEPERKGPEPARPTGPPGVADNPELRERIARMRAHGMTLQAIADRSADAEDVPSASGGAKWRPVSIKRAMGARRAAARRGERRRTDDGGGKV